MQRSYLIALVISLVAAGWLLSPHLGSLLYGATNAESVRPESAAPVAETPEVDTAKPLRVRVRRSVAETRVKSLTLTGQTEPSRQAMLKAETVGQVVAVEAIEGGAVKQGDIIAKLALDDRESRLQEAQALVNQRRIEYEAARKLSSKGFQTQIRLAESKTQMESAQAQLRRIELDIEHTVVRAPFDGILQDRLVEVGDYVGVGDPVALIVDLDPILAVAQLSERDAAVIRRNNDGQARLVTGEMVDGRVRYVSVVGAAGTRTFRVELEIGNSDEHIPAGLTAQLTLPIATIEAHRLSPAALTLNDAGIVGVNTVDERNVVHFHPVDLVDGDADGVWIGGLPREATIITVGQEFVLPGQTVVPVPEEVSRAPAGAVQGGQS